jgi:hypothetical protein
MPVHQIIPYTDGTFHLYTTCRAGDVAEKKSLAKHSIAREESSYNIDD